MERKKAVIKHILLPLLFCATITASAFAQNSARAVMRVSVEVVSSGSVETFQPKIVSLSPNATPQLGILAFNDIENVLITSPDVVKLVNQFGDEITMPVISNKEKRENAADTILYKGISKIVNEGNTVYKGILPTTIEYL